MGEIGHKGVSIFEASSLVVARGLGVEVSEY